MPVDPNHKYADEAHPDTVKDSCWRYGCHSDKVGPEPRGKTTAYDCLQHGPAKYDGHGYVAELVQVRIVTDWLPKLCGHTLRGTDPACTGCVNRSEDD